MALAAPTFDDEPVRRPGDFQRSKQGTPYVTDPGGALVKSGARKGEVKRLPYGRPSSFGKQIENTYNLAKWSERTVVLGLAIDFVEATDALQMPVLLAEAAKLVGADKDDPKVKAHGDAVVIAAKKLAKAGIAAERGTHAHALTEDDDEERDWIVRAEAGEVVGLDVGVQRALVEAWRAMLEREQLEVLATEFAMVHDAWRMAGTGDRIARLGRDLRFTMATGEIVVLPAGTVVVLDIKTGQRRTDAKGVVMYWQSYAVQIATYAGGQLYDVDTDERAPYPWPVDQRWALIAHLDVLGAIAGAPSCELVLVDIEAGRQAAELVLAAKAWEKRTDVFSIVTEIEPPQEADLPASPAVAEPDEVPIASPAAPESDRPPLAPVPTPRLPVLPEIDEGTFSSGVEGRALIAALEEFYKQLGAPERAWITALAGAAMRHNVTFHCKADPPNAQPQTPRRFRIMQGLLTLAHAGYDDDELLRNLVAIATGSDAPLFAGIEPGHALGAMCADEATTFARLCDDVIRPGVAIAFDDGGNPRGLTAA